MPTPSPAPTLWGGSPQNQPRSACTDCNAAYSHGGACPVHRPVTDLGHLSQVWIGHPADALRVEVEYTCR
jgi:hypothetical protein